MFKKTLHTLLLACILIVPLALKASDDNLYRNEEYNFRIKFPLGWEVRDGDGEHVVKKAVKDGSTVLILVRDSMDFVSEKERGALSEKEKLDIRSMEMNDLSDSIVEDISSGIINTQLESFPGSKIIEKGVRFIDNRKAIYFKANQKYKVQNLNAEGSLIYYSTFHKGKLYQIQGFYPKGSESQEPIINASLASFVFEDWNDPIGSTNINNKSLDKSTGSIYGLISEERWGTLAIAFVVGILFTWGLGLLVPLLLRFVFLKRPLSKWVSIIIVSLIWVIQLFIAAVLSGKFTGHSSLILAAIVSYWILRFRSVKKVKSSNETLLAEVKSNNINKEQVIIPSVTYCSKCGKEMKYSSAYCSKCGEKIEVSN